MIETYVSRILARHYCSNLVGAFWYKNWSFSVRWWGHGFDKVQYPWFKNSSDLVGPVIHLLECFQICVCGMIHNFISCSNDVIPAWFVYVGYCREVYCLFVYFWVIHFFVNVDYPWLLSQNGFSMVFGFVHGSLMSKSKLVLIISCSSAVLLTSGSNDVARLWCCWRCTSIDRSRVLLLYDFPP